MKRPLLFTPLLALAILTGCAGMADSMNQMAGLGVVKVEKSTFDGSETVTVSPNWLYESEETWSANNVKMGARWTSAAPDHVALILSYDSDVSSSGATYLGLQGIDINIEGRKASYSANTTTSLDDSGYNTVSKTIYTNSQNSVVIPFSILEAMMNATDCRIRVHTTKGYEDSIFSIERSSSGQSTAKFSMKEFIETVHSHK